jgi:hypothetical protein
MSNDQRALRSIMVVGPLISVFAAFAAAHDATWWILVPVLALVLLCVVQPDSDLGLMVIIIVVLHWVAVVEDRRTAWTFVAAAGLCLFHAAGAAATVTASAAPWSASMRRRWLQRCAAVLGLTLVASAAQLLLADRHFGANAALWALGLLLLAVTALVLRARAVAT